MKKSFVFGALLGGLAGACIAILKAPRSGEETRQRLRGRVEELTGERVEAQFRKGASKVRERAPELLERGKAILKERRPQIERGVAEVLDFLERLQKGEEVEAEESAEERRARHRRRAAELVEEGLEFMEERITQLQEALKEEGKISEATLE